MTAADERLAGIQERLDEAVYLASHGRRMRGGAPGYQETILTLVDDVRAITAERDALQARIAAVTVDVSHVDEATNGYVLAAAITARLAGADDDGVDRAIRQAHEDLAGDQPEATPEPDEMCSHYRGADEGCPAGCFGTPETPHLDPEPWVPTSCSTYRYPTNNRPNAILDRVRFAPRPADENGKAYEQDRKFYE